jgi:hypothetical protein
VKDYKQEVEAATVLNDSAGLCSPFVLTRLTHAARPCEPK